MSERMGARPRFKRIRIVDGILAFVILINILQLWLLTATVHGTLGGLTGIAIPAALVSLGCLGLNVGLLVYLYRFDREKP